MIMEHEEWNSDKMGDIYSRIEEKQWKILKSHFFEIIMKVRRNSL